MAYLVTGGLILAGVLALLVAMNRKAVAEISRRVSASGKRIIHIRLKALRSPLMAGLTPLAFVYRVTTVAEAETSKAMVRLYAYDPGRWFSRHTSNLRQLSGGVWRDA